MPAIMLPLFFSVMFAGVLVGSREKLRHIEEPAMTAKPKPTRRLEAAVRRGKVGTSVLSEQIRTTAVIAPADDSETALALFKLDGSPLLTLATADIAMARGWTKGRMVVARGENRREFGPAWPLNPTENGWELKLVTVSGKVYRCAGDTLNVEGELARLHKRINDAVFAHAS